MVEVHVEEKEQDGHFDQYSVFFTVSAIYFVENVRIFLFRYFKLWFVLD